MICCVARVSLVDQEASEDMTVSLHLQAGTSSLHANCMLMLLVSFLVRLQDSQGRALMLMTGACGSCSHNQRRRDDTTK